MKHIYIFLILFAFSCSSDKQDSAKDTPKKTDPLPSWNETSSKANIIQYVEDITNKESKNYIDPKDRIATFDNDGTLWSEQPMYFQLAFVIDQVTKMAANHPEWKEEQPFKAVLENDLHTLMAQGESGLMKLLFATHSDMSTDEFEKNVKAWIATAKHPRFDRKYSELVYQPMLELINYLKANEFQVFIVSGGGVEFMRPWAEEVYGIPRNQIIGSSLKEQFEHTDSSSQIIKTTEINFVDDKDGKPVAIQNHIGRKPIFAAGNSDGDLQMLQWTASNELKSFNLYVHHTDSLREWAYDRNSPIGKLDKGWDEAIEKGWTVANMKTDWKVIYPFDKK